MFEPSSYHFEPHAFGAGAFAASVVMSFVSVAAIVAGLLLST